MNTKKKYNNKSTNFASGTKNWSIKKRRENIKDIKKNTYYMYMILADDRTQGTWNCIMFFTESNKEEGVSFDNKKMTIKL